MSAIRLVVLASVVLGAWGSGRAADPELFDWGYLGRPLAIQRKPPTVRLDPIASPTPGAPALVGWGEELRVTVLLPPGASPGQPNDWLMALSTRGLGPDERPVGQPVSLRYPLEVHALEAGPIPDAVVLRAVLPAHPPRETYHLEVAGPGGLIGRRVHAVRVLGAPLGQRSFRFAIIGDHQLADPSTGFANGDLNNRSYSRTGGNAAQRMLRQQMDELAFWDPDFVLYLGDLVFGIDYRSEYPQTLGLYWSRPLASFMVPGNHDGMALYELALKEGWWSDALKSVRCARHVLADEVTASKVFAMLLCLYGDLKNMLFEDLSQDGLDYWRRYLGPGDFSFDLGGYHFVGLNSYSGTPQRRHGFVLGFSFIGLDLGVATVDNYGGWLTPQQLSRLEADLRRASDAGKRTVLFLHHDPRGTRSASWGQRFHVNLPFPTEPLGLRRFQEWNYEGNAEWDSDPDDARAGETQMDNSAVALLRLIATHVDYVFTGHIHQDRDEVVEPGQEISAGSAILATRRVVFSRVTTAASTPLDDDGYWGYRLVTGTSSGLANIAFRPDWGWASIPAGNLWLSGEGVLAGRYIPGAPEDLLYTVHNGLERPVEGLVRAYLDAAIEGWRFVASGQGAKVELVDVGRGSVGQNIYYLKVYAPGVDSGVVPPPRGEAPVLRIHARRALGNRVPLVAFRRSVGQVAPTQPVEFDASPTRDPEGEPIVAYIWDFGDGSSARGEKAVHSFARQGTYNVSLTAFDRCGAYATYAEGVVVAIPPSCAFSGTACAVTSTGLVLVGLVVVGWWYLRRRRRRTTQAL